MVFSLFSVTCGKTFPTHNAVRPSGFPGLKQMTVDGYLEMYVSKCSQLSIKHTAEVTMLHTI